VTKIVLPGLAGQMALIWLRVHTGSGLQGAGLLAAAGGDGVGAVNSPVHA
jgi:hypothetical protein